ncbi:MAG: hypothetical protein KDJ80_00795 [Nitratireductor sp.]|nr:hypothetical protein [Nitratireductor sp.]
MVNNPALILVWALLGAAIGTVIYLFMGGNLWVHLLIAVIGAVAGGSYAQSRKSKGN